MNNKKLFFSLYLISILFISCKTTNTTGGKIKFYTATEIDSIHKQNQIDFTTISGKAKVDISGNINQSATAGIDIEKDKFIGMSLRAFGVEGVKILITPDSIKILNRITSKYIRHDFSYIQNQLALRIDFNDLQNMIVGNLFFDDGNLYTSVAEDKYILTAQNPEYKNTIWFYPSFDLMRLFIEDMVNKRSVIIDYSDYQKLEQKRFAFLRHIAIDAVEKYEIDMQFTSVILNRPLDFTFTVNPKYEKVD